MKTKFETILADQLVDAFMCITGEKIIAAGLIDGKLVAFTT